MLDEGLLGDVLREDVAWIVGALILSPFDIAISNQLLDEQTPHVEVSRPLGESFSGSHGFGTARICVDRAC